MSERKWAAWITVVASIAFIWWGFYTRNVPMMIIGFLLNFVNVVAFAVRDVYRAQTQGDEESEE